MKKIKKLLVANRGEIALRVMRSAREMGIEVIAVYSDADTYAPHVLYADKSFYLGESPAGKSYLSINKIMKICVENGIDAIHPGYGFLSENSEFARKVENAGINFIGPSPKSIEIMGDKITSKKTVARYNVPLIPGSDGAVSSPAKASAIAEKIGFPVLIKASAGGGGKGMRVVYNAKDMEDQMNRAVSEAQSSFGNPEVFVEKYIEEPKHIEFQVFGDKKGNYVHLFERECSIQRRHQKVIEEAPSPALNTDLRKKMGEAAINVAKSCKYYGAGTVEFILDTSGEFFFLEMNTRLQVEHPVTEMITGIDLVKEQIQVARGNALSFTQEDLTISGHAIETRVYTEDPLNNFLPDVGTLITYITPGGPGIRLDDGYRQGMEIPIHYDPMIGKLIAHGKNRKEAIDRLKRAINDFEISGIQHSLPFSSFVLSHPAFIKGTFSTHFVEKHFKPELLKKNNPELGEAVALLHSILNTENAAGVTISENDNSIISKWRIKRKTYGRN